MTKIVIVDDEVHIRSLLQQTLEELEEDFELDILTAQNGGEGLALIKREQPLLVFLDVMMPIMNGYDVCAAIRQDAELANTKVVMLTAKGQEADRQRGLNAGANHFTTKPFDPDYIIELARNILEQDQ
ncbi:MAG: response regulator [Magnetococcus sp. DMHC-1]|nr:response regulator [Magnetococcales bacterium]